MDSPPERPLLDRLIAQGRAVPAANPGAIPPTPPRDATEEGVSLSAALEEMRETSATDDLPEHLTELAYSRRPAQSPGSVMPTEDG